MELTDGDYVLVEGAAWVEVCGVSIRIAQEHNGIMVTAYNSGKELGDSLQAMFIQYEDLDPITDMGVITYNGDADEGQF